MPRVVCPLCHSGFEANISRDNCAINCVTCGVAFNAMSFLTKDEFSKTKTPAVTLNSGSATSHSTRTGALPFDKSTGIRVAPALIAAGANGTSQKSPNVKSLQDELQQIRANLQTAEGEKQAAGEKRQDPPANPQLNEGSGFRVQGSGADVAALAPKSQEPRAKSEIPRAFTPAAPSIAITPPAPAPKPKPKTSARRPLLEGTFGPYDIEGEIARGGVGAVFRARERDGGREVALKVLLEGSESGDADRERFQHECETAKALSLPGMVQVYAVGEHDGRPFMAMELVKGRSLDKVISEKSLSVHDCLVLMKSVAETIGALHEAGYVHRDLKPGNILIDAFGSPKVADFGLVKSLDEITRLTASGLVCGTPAYMAPEQARGDGKAVDPRSDVWALGAVLYEMLSGKPPFQAENALRLMLRITKDQPQNLRRINMKVPQEVQEIVMKCLEKNPERRYPSARAMAVDIGHFLNAEPLESRTQAGMRVQRFIEGAAQNQRLLFKVAAGIAALAALVVLGRMALAPKEAGPLIELALNATADRSLEPEQRFEKAEKLLREAVSIDPKNGLAYLNLGLVVGRRAIDIQNKKVLDTHRMDEARKTIAKAAELSPQLRAESYRKSALLKMWLNDHVDEARLLEQAVELAPTNLSYREALGMAYWHIGADPRAAAGGQHLKSALREFQTIIGSDPSYPRVSQYINTLKQQFLLQPAATPAAITTAARR
ncbi:MAG TPA: serine/threonine-protein kinase [Planctomycetota bacterium]|jgi:tetratricopeptide (TPR) repeat protein